MTLALTPRPGSDMASGLRTLGGGHSRFGPLLDKADGGVVVHIPAAGDGKTPPPDPELMAAMMRNSLPLPPALRETGPKLLAVLVNTVAIDGLDFGVLVSLRPKDEVGVVAGIKLQSGKKLDQALRDLYKSLPAEQKKEFAVDWNHDKHGSARIHRGRPANEKEELFLAIREDVAIFAFDKSGLEPLKEALDALTVKSAAPASPIIRARVSSRALLVDEDLRKIAEKELSTEQRDKLFAEASLEGGADLRLRLRASTPLLRLMMAYSESGK